MTDRTDGIRCPNPDCRSKAGEEVVGYYRTVCRKCGSPIVIVRAGNGIIELPSVRVAVNVKIEPKRT